MIDVCIGKDRAGNGRLSQTFSRMQFGTSLDLRAQVGRRSHQKPGMRVSADGNLRLAMGLAMESSRAQGAAVGAGAIPLREGSAGGRAENLHTHNSECSS